jgi:GMP reductase
MRILTETKLDFRDVLIVPKRSTLTSRQDVNLVRSFVMPNSKRTWTGIPIVCANMDTIATPAMATELAKHSMATALHKHFDESEMPFWNNDINPDLLFYSMGITENDANRWNAAAKDFPTINNVCIDVANGYTEMFVDFVKWFRSEYTDITIMAGNVVTPEMTEALILAGADIIKVGIGPGSACTTRKVTGVGYPQLSAIMECADAAHGLKGLICADGGCQTPGDIAKAFGAGADFVMIGGMLAGHDECAGDVVDYDTIFNNQEWVAALAAMTDIQKNELKKIIPSKKFKRFYGMSSTEAMTKHSGGVSSYRASEGKSVDVPYRGPVEATILEILGGLRSACTYTGAVSLKELSKRTT